MEFTMSQIGQLLIEKLYHDDNLSAEEKLLLVYLQYMHQAKKKETLNLSEVGSLETLFKLQLMGYIKVEQGSITLVFQKEGFKTCRKCLEEKILDDFNNSSQTKDGKNAYCKPCVMEYNTDYREENPEKIKEYAREYGQQRTEKLRSARTERMLRAVDNLKSQNEPITVENVVLFAGVMKETVEKDEEVMHEITQYEIKERAKIEADKQKLERKGLTYQIDNYGSVIIEEPEVTQVGAELNESNNKKSEDDENEGVIDNGKYEIKKMPFTQMEKEIVRLLTQTRLKQKEIAEYVNCHNSYVSAIKIKFLKEK